MSSDLLPGSGDLAALAALDTDTAGLAQRAATGGRGADYVFDTVGAPATLAQALQLSRKGGTVVVTGLARLDATAACPLFPFVMQEKRLVGSLYGSGQPARDVPRLVELYREGKLKLAELATRPYALTDINDALDALSGGRFIFGVGVGWNREEMENHGTDPRTRGKLTDERIRAMIEMWTKEEPEFHGRYVDFDPIGIWPKPVQKPYPPIYVGGGRGAFERIVQFGDAWLANGLPPDKLEPMLGGLREVAGRDVPTTVFNASSDLKDLEEYRRLGVERVLLGLPTLPESETLKQLDNLAQVATDTR